MLLSYWAALTGILEPATSPGNNFTAKETLDPTCLSRGFYGCKETPRQVGEERVCLVYTSVIGGSQARHSTRAGTWRQEADAEAMGGAAYWLVSPGFLSLPSYRRLWTAPLTLGWELPRRPTIEKRLLQLDLMEALAQLRLLSRRR